MTRYLLVCFGWLVLVVTGSAFGQEAGSPVGPQTQSGANRITRMIEVQSVTPYVGVTTDGSAIEGLYSIDPDRGASSACSLPGLIYIRP